MSHYPKQSWQRKFLFWNWNKATSISFQNLPLGSLPGTSISQIPYCISPYALRRFRWTWNHFFNFWHALLDSLKTLRHFQPSYSILHNRMTCWIGDCVASPGLLPPATFTPGSRTGLFSCAFSGLAIQSPHYNMRYSMEQILRFNNKIISVSVYLSTRVTSDAVC